VGRTAKDGRGGVGDQGYAEAVLAEVFGAGIAVVAAGAQAGIGRGDVVCDLGGGVGGGVGADLRVGWRVGGEVQGVVGEVGNGIGVRDLGIGIRDIGIGIGIGIGFQDIRIGDIGIGNIGIGIGIGIRDVGIGIRDIGIGIRNLGIEGEISGEITREVHSREIDIDIDILGGLGILRRWTVATAGHEQRGEDQSQET
jgi:hypothetical protein